MKLNQRLAALPELDRLFVFPAMSDTGNSVGAALFSVLEEKEQENRETLRSVYWGSEWSEDACASALAVAGFETRRFEEVSRCAGGRSIQPQRGRWFRAAWNRAARVATAQRARATDAEINRTLNARLARTEFMPFAPSVLEEHAAGIFDNVGKSADCLPFMTITCNVKPEWRGRIPAVVHVDGTARPQTVSRAANPLYWSLIEAYGSAPHSARGTRRARARGADRLLSGECGAALRRTASTAWHSGRSARAPEN